MLSGDVIHVPVLASDAPSNNKGALAHVTYLAVVPSHASIESGSSGPLAPRLFYQVVLAILASTLLPKRGQELLGGGRPAPTRECTGVR